VSTKLWTASEKSAVDPVTNAATSLVAATRTLPSSAAQTTNEDESVEPPESEGLSITECASSVRWALAHRLIAAHEPGAAVHALGTACCAPPQPIDNFNGSIVPYTRPVKRWRDGQMTLGWSATRAMTPRPLPKLRGPIGASPLRSPVVTWRSALCRGRTSALGSPKHQAAADP